MLYGIKDRDTSLIVAAADDVAEFETYRSALDGVSWAIPDLMEMLQDDRYAGFVQAPVVLSFADAEACDAYIAGQGIELCKPNGLRDRQSNMLNKATAEQAKLDAAKDTRTLAEVYGLTENDPWDRRTDVEKAKAEEKKKKAEEARKRGELTGDSFGGRPKPALPKTGADTDEKSPQVHVRRIDVETKADGTFVVTGALARKRAEHPDDSATAETADSDDYSMPDTSMVAVFHRVMVQGAKLTDIEPVLAAANIVLSETALASRNDANGCWMAFPRQSQAELIAGKLAEAGMTVSQSTINQKGEAILPDGTKVVEAEDAAFHTRPWNEKTKAAWDRMSDEERAEEQKKVKGDEFYFCSYHNEMRRTTTVYIAPTVWWDANTCMYEEPLNIGHILPIDMIEVAPGIYESNARSQHVLHRDLHVRGFTENLLMQIEINNTRPFGR